MDVIHVYNYWLLTSKVSELLTHQLEQMSASAKEFAQRLVSRSWSYLAETDRIFRKASCVLTSSMAKCNDTFSK